MLAVKTPEEVLRLIEKEFRPIDRSESIPLSEALGRVLAGDVTAKLYDLDFLPICVEEYDLLIPEAVWGSGLVKQLIRTLKSEDFKARLEAMGGYTLDRPGELIEVF